MSDWLAPQPLDGPYTDENAACRALVDNLVRRDGPPEAEVDRLTYSCGSDPGHTVVKMKTAAALAAPFLGALPIVVLRRGGAVPADSCTLALRKTDGWWLIGSDAFVCQGPVGTGHDFEGIEVDEISVVPLFPDRPRVLRYRYSRVEYLLSQAPGPGGRGRQEHRARRRQGFVMFCGLGASGRPSCTPPIPERFAPWSSKPVTLRFTTRPGGRLVISGPRQQQPDDLDDEEWARLLGEHLIQFP